MKTSRVPQRTRRLSVEGLESRAMLATASVSGGMLFINGAAGNVAENVTVTQLVDGRIQVTGVGATPRVFGPILGIFADMKGGNDTITIGEPERPLPLLSTVNIRLGDGSDVANISVNIPGLVNIDGGMQFNGGAQNDLIVIDRSLIGSLMVNTYAGDDELYISRSGILSVYANLGSETLFLGQRDYDYVDISASAIGLANIMIGASGASTQLNNEVYISSTIFGSLNVNGGSGIDLITIDSAGEGFGTWVPSHIVNTAETLEPLLEGLLSQLPINSLLSNIDLLLERLPSIGGVSLPGGIEIDDVIGLIGGIDLDEFDLSDTLEDLLSNVDLSFVGDNTVIGTLYLNTFLGNDTISVSETAVLGNTTIFTGQGNDNVNLNLFTSNYLFAALGQGNDNLRLIGVSSEIAYLDGGPGIDGLLNFQSQTNGRRSRTVINFEVPLLPPVL
jgi:hypothetical protein